MTKQPTIVVTGTAGFIGSVMVQYLNENGLTDLLLVDDFGVEAKRRLQNKFHSSMHHQLQLMVVVNMDMRIVIQY